MEKESNYVCTEEHCGAKFSRPCRLAIHMRTHTGERPYVCSFEDCTKSYVRNAHLVRHEATHKKDTFKCAFEDCSVTFTRAEALKRHIDNKHLMLLAYQCEYCGQSFNKHSLLKRHEYQHTGLKRYTCSEQGCEMRFLTPSKLKRHLKTHQGYPCSYEGCGVICKTWSNRLRHMNIHSKTYDCETCSKVFSTSSNLRAHKKLHLSPAERPIFFCTVQDCNRFYTEEKNMRYHVQKYHEQRPFPCQHDGCALSFKTQEKLDRHTDIYHLSESSKRKKKKLKKRRKIKWKIAATLAGYKNEDGILSESDNERTKSVSVPLQIEPVGKRKSGEEVGEQSDCHDSGGETPNLPSANTTNAEIIHDVAGSDIEYRNMKGLDKSCMVLHKEEGLSSKSNTDSPNIIPTCLQLETKGNTKCGEAVGEESLAGDSSTDESSGTPSRDTTNTKVIDGEVELVLEDDSTKDFDKSEMVLHTVLVTLNH